MTSCHLTIEILAASSMDWLWIVWEIPEVLLGGNMYAPHFFFCPKTYGTIWHQVEPSQQRTPSCVQLTFCSLMTRKFRSGDVLTTPPNPLGYFSALHVIACIWIFSFCWSLDPVFLHFCWWVVKTLLPVSAKGGWAKDSQNGTPCGQNLGLPTPATP